LLPIFFLQIKLEPPQFTPILHPKKQEKPLFLIAKNVLKNIGGIGYRIADPGGSNAKILLF
jgi:hypothetical protein